MKSYRCLTRQIYTFDDFKLVPLRYEDRYDIMKWRNEQMYHLRQTKLLTASDQDTYFSNIISELYNQENPTQILFSLLYDNKLVGYGGLVHINWIDKNAEVSFLMDTSLEKDFFSSYWKVFLSFIRDIAFDDLKFYKIYTYAFDLRPNLYQILESVGYIHEATLKGHSFYNGQFINVLIHSLFNKFYSISFRRATLKDAKVLFDWVNDPVARNYAINTDLIRWEDHLKWLANKIDQSNCLIYIFLDKENPIGQVRLEKKDDLWVISYFVDEMYRGYGLGSYILKMILWGNSDKSFLGIVRSDNLASMAVFKKLGFVVKNISKINEVDFYEFYMSNSI